MTKSQRFFCLNDEIDQALSAVQHARLPNTTLIVDHIIEIEGRFVDQWSLRSINVMAPQISFAVRPGFYMAHTSDSAFRSLFLVDMEGKLDHIVTPEAANTWPGVFYLQIQDMLIRDARVLEIRRHELEILQDALDIQQRRLSAESFTLIGRLNRKEVQS